MRDTQHPAGQQAAKPLPVLTGEAGGTRTNAMHQASIVAVMAAILLLFGLLLSGCGHAKPMTSSPYLDGLSVSLQETPLGTDTGMHAYSVTITDQAGARAELDRVHIRLSMSMRDMEHETEGDMTRKGPGEYAAKLKWAMQGEWQAVITLQKDGHARRINSFH